MTPAQARALAALYAITGDNYAAHAVASQIAWRLYGTASSRGRGPGGRPAAAARLLDALHTQGLTSLDWDKTTYQRQWSLTPNGRDAAKALLEATK